jgi:FAD/FMN-containing dehydrogenase
MNRELHKFGVFVPHGQCSHVHVGGHSHTGGYGLPGRAFGLFADHIVEARVFTADGQVRWYKRDATDPEEAEMFYAVLGGSPGNYGILTHIKLKVHKDSDHPNARGLKVCGWARGASVTLHAPHLPGACCLLTCP